MNRGVCRVCCICVEIDTIHACLILPLLRPGIRHVVIVA